MTSIPPVPGAPTSNTRRARLARLREEAEPLVAGERRAALRALLQQPLLTPDGAQAGEFALVRRHRDWLATWFAHHANWSLSVTAEVRLCDFRPGIPIGSQAGIEAALEASGLLDAWVLPDGSLVDPETEDAFLVDLDATTSEGATDHLGQWLVPAVEDTLAAPAVMPAQIERLLRRIGAGRESGSYWVAEDGAWRMGPLAGRWSKSDADFIGETTRAAARRRRIVELRQDLAVRETEHAALSAALSELEDRKNSADQEAASLPDDQPVHTAGYQHEQTSQAINDTFIALKRPPLATPWCPALADAMRRERRVVHEEAVAN